MNYNCNNFSNFHQRSILTMPKPRLNKSEKNQGTLSVLSCHTVILGISLTTYVRTKQLDNSQDY